MKLTITLAKYSGYMSPEYAMDGVFSVKSDVFSFGVLILEIISGKKNRAVYGIPPHMNLVAHVSQNFISCVHACTCTHTCTYIYTSTCTYSEFYL